MTPRECMTNWRWWAALPALLAAYYVNRAAEFVASAAESAGNALWRFIKPDGDQ